MMDRQSNAGPLGKRGGPRAVVAPGGARVNTLYLPSVLLAVTSLFAPPAGLAFGLGGAALWWGAALMTREGLAAEQAFLGRKTARRPALPRKMLGSAMIALGTAFGALAHGQTAGGAVIYALVAGALHAVAFGLDPLRDRFGEGVDAHQHDRVARVVERAEEHLSGIRTAIAALHDRSLNSRVAAFEHSAREMIAEVEDDPRDLPQARRYLGVYLQGAQDASEKFAAHYARHGEVGARRTYEALLDDLEQNFTARTQQMLQDDATDMSIEIEVLRERLQRDGVTPTHPAETE
ncbi:5-bromo-4-chloroindolyl phosphate hydrolysis family protein [Pseudooceanicola spongiae]|jgi:hypothetical protein|uniref:5-bromo-4-chloroindolyl phosphate hydrolysis protein n=1 Tax=Pseudooceanicola spongiae TaxID=2613965 RepID=A0A7L9WGX8_9RHOB|nr:5-bromo-4-chloroindolyl phosphate hydrolysis family protein [Pseudooceanicola spongiae]QOL79479.1 hypothetical protein F3W81_00670 [Pseudooceanicola spongiae]